MHNARISLQRNYYSVNSVAWVLNVSGEGGSVVCVVGVCVCAVTESSAILWGSFTCFLQSVEIFDWQHLVLGNSH